MNETKACQSCKQDFTIESEDFRFYERIKVPPPTFCPFCRLQRRFSWRNERGLYYRKCDLCQKKIIAMYPTGVEYPVYCRECWLSDNWDPLDYGQDYDFKKPFLVQFKELLLRVPQISSQVANSVNCEYANQITDCKNCYLITSGKNNEDCAYSYRLHDSKNVLDSFLSLRAENIYESVDVTDSAQIYFSEDCIDSLGARFSYDVRGSQNCFMSSNLRNGSYVFRNERISKEEYLEKIKEVDTGSYSKLKSYLEEFEKLKLSSLHKYSNKKNTVNFTGHSASNSKDCYHCFNIANDENCRYCTLLNNARDCMDINNGCCQMELCYECSTAGVNTSGLLLSSDVWPEVNNLTYCSSCKNGASYLFGCVSMRSSKYCVLNKQYSEAEYRELVSKIRKHMDDMPYVDSRGIIYKYGEFFPTELSLFPYADSAAQDYIPLDKEEIVGLGFIWRDPEDKPVAITVDSEAIPDHIKDVPDSILGEVLECVHRKSCSKEHCAGGFKITDFELRFYRKNNIALPRLCPNCRHYQRFKKINPPKLWHRACACVGRKSQAPNSKSQTYRNTTEHFHGEDPCPNEFETSYAPNRPEIVYCEQCYNAEVV